MQADVSFKKVMSKPELVTVALDVQQHLPELLALFDAVREADIFSPQVLNNLTIKLVHYGDRTAPQASVIQAYKELVALGVIPFERELFERLRLKPTRTLSGVAPVAVLTGPYPCPADCIFCPDAKGVPRSYLPDEPAVQRAMRARFDPFKETATRMQTLESMGHSTDKIELLVIGATWSAYPKKYQEWFIRRCLDAMNGTPSSTLLEAQTRNQRFGTSLCRFGHRDAPRLHHAGRGAAFALARGDQGTVGSAKHRRLYSGIEPARAYAARHAPRRAPASTGRFQASPALDAQSIGGNPRIGP